MTCTKFNTATAEVGDTKVVGNVTYQYKGDEIWEAITAPLSHDQLSNLNATGAHDSASISISSGGTLEDLAQESKYTYNEYDILFAYGQSNCLGKPVLSGSTGGFPTITSKSLFFDVTDSTLKPMVQNINSWARDSDSTSTGYAWAEFAEEWHRMTGRGIILVMGASGGKYVSQLSKGYRLNLYENAVEGMAALNTYLSTRPQYVIGKKMCMWHQGESDQSNNTNWKTYYTSLANIFDNLTVDAGITSFGICVVGNPTNRLETQWATIQNAQRYLATQRGNVYVAFDGCGQYNSSDGTLGVDGVHYTQIGLNVMGYGAAKSAASVLYGSNKPMSYLEAERTSTPISAGYQSRVANFNAVIGYDGTNWVIRTKDVSSQRFRSANVSKIVEQSDHLQVFLSGHQSSLMTFGATVTSANDKNIDINTVTDFIIDGNSDTYIRIYFNADINIGVRTDTGKIRSGLPLVDVSASSMIGSIFSSSAANNITTLSHNAIKYNPTASFSAGPLFTDLTPVVSCRSESNTSTKVSVKKADGTVTGMESIVAVVAFKAMQLKPSNLIYESGLLIQLSGAYLI